MTHMPGSAPRSSFRPSAVDTARWLCQEARVVLTSLRGGPPHIARGELAQDLMELRDRIPLDLERNINNTILKSGNHHPTVMTYRAEYSRPFLAVVMDPRASGPHTAVALSSIKRLLSRHALPANEHVMKAILACKFEQTNAGQDETVEMALADVLCLLLQLGVAQIAPNTVHEAFHTVFFTRNTFVHSPALGYHLEGVLEEMVQACQGHVMATRVILEFLLHHLLNTPLIVSPLDDELTRETQAANDSTRVLCLRLIRLALEPCTYEIHEPWVPLIQDDLCLTLLMTGQAIWHNHRNYLGTHLMSPAVLCEICATICFLWNCLPLRPLLMGPFEAIWTGFYTRALCLLRRRREAVNAAAYHANLAFDAELEIILESLTDLLHLHDHSQTIDQDGGGALETMFAFYDCHLQRSDVAVGLYVELCRACGGTVNEEGVALVASAGPVRDTSGTSTHASMSSLDDADDMSAGSSVNDPTVVQVDHPWRPVPAHLKELCATAIVGGMKCLFRDDKASPQKLMERASRNRSILSGNGAALIGDSAQEETETASASHVFRTIKVQKRFTRKAARIFNLKSSRGIEFLVDCGLMSDPITPLQVATFLRHGIVVGLDKAAVGSYLGEAGKVSSSAPVWERDWFHKDCLDAYCGLFSFQDQSLLDSLRMFLAAFRLPGEAQQIDRILQAFANKCGVLCQEASALLSTDPKRASDAAYLLSFSIIMLNTDQHNTNIRADRKMKVDDFVKNNTDYGREITEPGKELPRDYLVAIYESIKEEEIRTEGEGADGAMTVERWKDVMRQAHAANKALEASKASDAFQPSHTDADDLTELVLEHVWKPILSAIAAFWNVSGRFPHGNLGDEGALMSPQMPNMGPSNGSAHGPPNHHAVMLGVQGARLGMDMSLEMLNGVRQLGRIDIFRKIFGWVCDYTGLLQGCHPASSPSFGVGKAISNALVESVEAQAAVVVVLRTAVEAGEDLDIDGWKRLWAIICELRDARLLPSFLLHESDEDLLRPNRRQEWIAAMLEGDMADIVADESCKEGDGRNKKKAMPSRPSSMLGVLGRAFFGSDGPAVAPPPKPVPRSGKEDTFIWNDLAPSDGESDDEDGNYERGPDEVRKDSVLYVDGMHHLSPGAIFEAQLIRESIDIDQHIETPITGLERAEETHRYQRSPRARLRNRLRQACQLESFISDTRFLNDESIKLCLMTIADLIPNGTSQTISGQKPTEIDPSKLFTPGKHGLGERSISDVSMSTPTFSASTNWSIPISPASEAFCEVMICEIALKNRDRLKMLWHEFLYDHYASRLTKLFSEPPVESLKGVIPPQPALEKRITGLLRLSICSTSRGDVANEIVSLWKDILPYSHRENMQSHLKAFHRHLSEGLYRLISNGDSLLNLDEFGWEGLMALCNWCAMCGCSLPPLRKQSTPLPEDDPAVQTYRAIHLLLNSADLEDIIPCSLIDSLRTLVAAGDTRNYPQLSLSTLDLLQVLNQKKVGILNETAIEKTDFLCLTFWRRIVEAMAEAAEHPRFSSVRQHALSVLTDLFLDRQNALVPVPHICRALSDICVPLAGRCIVSMQMGRGAVPSTDELMIEFELCIGLIFKPLRHHLKDALTSHLESHVFPLWKAVLAVLEELLAASEEKVGVPQTLLTTMHDLATEHLQNAIIMLVASGVLLTDPKSASDISTATRTSVLRMGVSREVFEKWMQKGTA